MNRKIVLITFLLAALSTSFSAYSQGITPQNMEKLRKMEDSLIVTADSMYEAFIPDTRIGYSERFARQLIRTLKIPNSYQYPFDTLKKLVNIIYSDDNSFRIFNWGIAPDSYTKRYYGAIQLPHEILKLIGLNDYSEQTGKGAEDSVLSGGKWFGAYYYRIKTLSVNDKKVHLLFGLNESNPLCNRKVLDPMSFTEQGVTFGAPIFGYASTNFPRQKVNRFVLEYKKSVSASMNWDEEKQMIVFDKLVSLSNDPTRKYTFVPSGQYDGFRWDNELWHYQRDLIDVRILQDGEAPGGDDPK